MNVSSLETLFPFALSFFTMLTLTLMAHKLPNKKVQPRFSPHLSCRSAFQLASLTPYVPYLLFLPHLWFLLFLHQTKILQHWRSSVDRGRIYSNLYNFTLCKNPKPSTFSYPTREPTGLCPTTCPTNSDSPE